MAVKDISLCSLSSQTCKQTDNQKLVSHSNENSRYWTWMEMLQPVWESRAPELPKTFTKCRQEPVGNNWAQMYEAANVSDQTFSLLQNKPGRVLQAGILQDRLIILSGTTANTIPEQKLCTKQPSREESTHPDGSELQRNFKECPCNPGWQQRGCCTWKNHQHSYTQWSWPTEEICLLFSSIITHRVIRKIKSHSDSFGTHSCLGLNSSSGLYTVLLSPSLPFQTVQTCSELLVPWSCLP